MTKLVKHTQAIGGYEITIVIAPGATQDEIEDRVLRTLRAHILEILRAAVFAGMADSPEYTDKINVLSSWYAWKSGYSLEDDMTAVMQNPSNNGTIRYSR